MSITEIQNMLNNFSIDRKTLAQNNTLETVQSLLRREMDEFEESPDPTELADILIFTLTIANLMGWNMDEQVREKIALNILRFESKDFQTGDYEKARQMCKDKEQPIIEEFYS